MERVIRYFVERSVSGSMVGAAIPRRDFVKIGSGGSLIRSRHIAYSILTGVRMNGDPSARAARHASGRSRRAFLSKFPKIAAVIVHDDVDTVVPVLLARTWADVMKSLRYQHLEVSSGDHGTVITSPEAGIFALFAKHSR